MLFQTARLSLVRCQRDLHHHHNPGWGKLATAMTMTLALIACLWLSCACTNSANATVISKRTPLTETATASELSLNQSASPTPSAVAVQTATSPLSETTSSAEADLKLLGPPSLFVNPGDTTSYTLTVHNLGPDLATGLLLTTTLPPGLSLLDLNASIPLCQRQGHTVRCEAGTVHAGSAVTVTLDLSANNAGAGNGGASLSRREGEELGWSCNIVQELGSSSVTCSLPALKAGSSTDLVLAFAVDETMVEPILQAIALNGNEADLNPMDNRAEIAMVVAQVKAGVGEYEATLVGPHLTVVADGPTAVIAGDPFTYTYTFGNQGAMSADNVRFEYTLTPSIELLTYTPSLPPCQQQGSVLICTLQAAAGEGAVTYTLIITGYEGQSMILEPDPLLPGWPICTVLKERTYLHILICELGDLRPAQTTQVQMVLMAGGLMERTLENTISVYAQEQRLTPIHLTETYEITVRVAADLEVRFSDTFQRDENGHLRYALLVHNHGPSAADNVTLTAALTAAADQVVAIPDKGDPCLVEPDETVGSSVACPVGRLDRGESATIQFDISQVDLPPQRPFSEFTHSAKLLADQRDPDPSNNALTETFPQLNRGGG